MDIFIEESCQEGTSKETRELRATSKRSTSLLDLPVELLKDIISDLPVPAIPNFMVNRFLRPICEQCLYERIMLGGQPRRSIRLLETFTLRPDLAQLVRDLTIDFNWVNEYGLACNEVPDGLKPDGAEALSLAQNIRCLKMDGIGNWIHAPMLSRLRGAVSKMKLTRLSTPWIGDQMTLSNLGSLAPQEGRDRELVAEIRSVFQAQPQLEHLFFSPSFLSDQLLSTLKDGLLPSDIPNLKSLETSPRVAVAFIAVTPNLECLALFLIQWDDEIFSQLKSSSKVIRSSLRRLIMTTWHRDSWLWENLASIFSLFPSMETLCITVTVAFARKNAQSANYFFEKIASCGYALPSLRSVEVKYDWPDSVVETRTMVDLRMRCPQLETIIISGGNMWMFRKGDDVVMDPAPVFMGTVEPKRHLGPSNDLPPPK
ncbi:hypothetical protein FRC04_002048 [Tulasnella sp. 424]|nr:hypothetical protein FRC04_002048 [Tulasnella sp. 424]